MGRAGRTLRCLAGGGAWGDALAPAVRDAVSTFGPDVLVTSMFCQPLSLRLRETLQIPSVYINPAFYVGPDPPRPFVEDYPEPHSLWWFERCVLRPLLEADMVLHATDPEFDLGFDALPSNHHYVGPLNWDAPGEVPSVMNNAGPPWVTASVSTAQQMGEMDLLRTILDAARELPARMLVTAPDHDLAELGRVPNNVILHDFVPHGPALERSALMLSHSDHGAVMKAMWHGVPMVLTPWDRDQHGVGYPAARLGVASIVKRDELTKKRLVNAMSGALQDTLLQKSAEQHGTRLRQTDPVARACGLLASL